MKAFLTASVIVCILSIARAAHPELVSYTVCTIAGLPSATGASDGTNDSAQFTYPDGIGLDSAGNIFLSDEGTHTIRKLTHAGTNWVVTTIAGSAGHLGSSDGTNSDARFFGPQGLAVADDGTLYIADTYNHVIRRVVPAGTNWIITTIAGIAGAFGAVDGTNSAARFNYPIDVVVDGTGNLFIADYQSARIRRITPVGTNWVVTTIAGSSGGSRDGTNLQARFSTPHGIAMDNVGSLYVADDGNSTIRKLTPSGTNWVVTTIAGSAGQSGNADGTNSGARFYHPYRVAADNYGALYVTDGNNHTLRRITPSGTNWIVSTVVGSAGNYGTNDGPGTAARFFYPVGVALDAAGDIFVADRENHVVRFGQFNPSLSGYHAADHFVISWPRLAASYTLQTSSNLDSSASWVAVTNGMVVSDDNLVLTNEMLAPNGFYRLRKQ